MGWVSSKLIISCYYFSYHAHTTSFFPFHVSALKLRYTLPVHIPSHLSGTPISTPLISPSKMQSFTFPNKVKMNHRRESPVMFDARVVAKREEGWEDMLESVLFAWVDKVIEERRVA